LTDIDGDSRYELLLGRKGSAIYGALNAPPSGATGTIPQPAYRESQLIRYFTDSEWKYWFMDFNGDGQQDPLFAFLDDSGPPDTRQGVQPTFYESTGNGFRRLKVPYNADKNFWFAESGLKFSDKPNDVVDNGVRVADIDGDGRAELIVTGMQFKCWNWFAQPSGDVRNNCLFNGQPMRKPFIVRFGYDRTWHFEEMPGTEFSPPVETYKTINGVPLHWIEWGSKLTTMLDVDGDGLPELIQPRAFHRDNIVLQVYKRESRKADLLKSVTDSLTGKTEVSYLPMSNRDVYTPAKDCVYPLYCPTRGRWLVRQVKRPTGLATPTTTDELHSYEAAREDLSGRGWLGFGQHLVLYPQRANSRIVYTFDNQTRAGDRNQFYPFAGLVKQQDTQMVELIDHFIYENTITKTWDYQNIATSADRVFVRPKQECTKEKEAFDGFHSVVCTTYTGYDQFGYAKTLTRTGGFETHVTETTYEHRDTSSPRLLGIVTQQKETSTAAGKPPVIRTTDYVPDANGLESKETIEQADTGTLKLETEFVRNSVGQVTLMTVRGDASAPHPTTGVWTKAPQARMTIIDYDDFGYKMRVTNPEGHQETFAYDPAFGVEIAHLDEDRVLTRKSYDRFGRLVFEDEPVGRDLFHSYEIRSTHPLVLATSGLGDGNVQLENSEVFHDVLGRAVVHTNKMPQGRTRYIFTRYDVNGRVEGISAPTFVNDITKAKFDARKYDGLDRLTERKDADGALVLTGTYSKLTSTMTNGLGKKHVVVRDPVGEPLTSESQDQNGVVVGNVTFDYGPFRLMEKATVKLKGKTVDTVTTYDRLGRRISIQDPDRGKTTFVPNSFGELAFEKDNSGAVSAMTYDQMGRILSTTDSDGKTQFVYDVAAGGIGDLASAVSPDGIETARSYDEFNRPTRTRVTVPDLDGPGKPGALDMEQFYDPAGRAGGLRYPTVPSGKRFEVNYEYSQSAGEFMWKVTDGTGKTLWQAEDFSAFGVLTQEVFGNKLRVTRNIDGNVGLLRGMLGAFVDDPFAAESPTPPGIPAGKPHVQDLVYDYDDARNVKLRQDRSKSLGMGGDVNVDETYEYDDLNRLSAWTVVAGGTTTRYAYPFDDDYGNLKGRTTPSAVNQWTFEYTSAARPHAITRAVVNGVEKLYDYDALGRRTKDGDRTITYTDSDLPKTVKRGTTTLATFGYDAFHDRIRKSIPGVDYVTISDLYERKSAGSNTHTFRVAGPGRTVAEIDWDDMGTSLDERYFHIDRLGSIELISGKTSGAVSGRQRFEPYGNTVDPTNPINNAITQVTGGTRLGFTGMEHDEDLGFVDFGGRVYDPSSGAFLTPDPAVPKLAWAHAFHPYSYVVNNPANMIDPTGFDAEGAEASGDTEGDDPEGSDDEDGGGTATGGEGQSMRNADGSEPTVLVDGFQMPDNTAIPGSVIADDTGAFSQVAPAQKAKATKKTNKKRTRQKTLWLTKDLGEGYKLHISSDGMVILQEPGTHEKAAVHDPDAIQSEGLGPGEFLTPGKKGAVLGGKAVIKGAPIVAAGVKYELRQGFVKKAMAELQKAVNALARKAASMGSKVAQKIGRSGKQARLRELMNDPKVARHFRGWIKNEIRHMQRLNKPRKAIRLPYNSRRSNPASMAGQRGTELAHPRLKPARDGFDYSEAQLQNWDLHKMERPMPGPSR
jgi:RHS repeat-associated protein